VAFVYCGLFPVAVAAATEEWRIGRIRKRKREEKRKKELEGRVVGGDDRVL